MNNRFAHNLSSSSQAKALAKLAEQGVLFTKDQAAELLAISRSAFNILLATKRLQGLRIGRRTFIVPAALERFLDSELYVGGAR